MKTDTGGPAFPARPADMEAGMTLRDYFAAKALTGYRSFAAQWYVMHGTEFAEPMQLAKWAYMDADAMLKERDK